MPSLIRSDAKTFTHSNYATSTSPATKTLPANTTSILIHNVDATIGLLVSFDAGTTFKALAAGASLSMDCNALTSYVIKSASGTPSAECLYGVEG